jgi:hypothetical protein
VMSMCARIDMHTHTLDKHMHNHTHPPTVALTLSRSWARASSPRTSPPGPYGGGSWCQRSTRRG